MSIIIISNFNVRLQQCRKEFSVIIVWHNVLLFVEFSLYGIRVRSVISHAKRFAAVVADKRQWSEIMLFLERKLLQFSLPRNAAQNKQVSRVLQKNHLIDKSHWTYANNGSEIAKFVHRSFQCSTATKQNPWRSTVANYLMVLCMMNLPSCRW